MEHALPHALQLLNGRLAQTGRKWRGCLKYLKLNPNAPFGKWTTILGLVFKTLIHTSYGPKSIIIVVHNGSPQIPKGPRQYQQNMLRKCSQFATFTMNMTSEGYSIITISSRKLKFSLDGLFGIESSNSVLVGYLEYETVRIFIRRRSSSVLLMVPRWS